MSRLVHRLVSWTRRYGEASEDVSGEASPASPAKRNYPVLAPIAEDGMPYPTVLPDADAIADYLEEVSPHEIDRDFVARTFTGKHAVLERVAIDTIHEGERRLNRRWPEKERQYRVLPVDTMPPALLEAQQLWDGHHRYRTRRAAADSHFWCYVVRAGFLTPGALSGSRAEVG